MTPLQKLTAELVSRANKSQAEILQRFFKTGPGQYGAGDRFLGLKVPLQRQIAYKYANLDRPALQTLLNSRIHEFRLVALLILTAQYEAAQDFKSKKKIADFYLKNARRINNWDLVDLSVYKILGDFLLLQESVARSGRKAKRQTQIFLEKLAGSKNLWERRMAMVATYAFIHVGRSAETFAIARKLLRDEHDLIHKAVGWMLREAGKRTDEAQLKKFLTENHKIMPRTALRYAIERLEPRERERYLRK